MNYIFTLDSVFLQVPPKIQNQLDKPVCLLNKPVSFTHANILLSDVNEPMYSLGSLPFSKIHVNCFLAQGDSPCASTISKYMLCVRELVSLSEFQTFPSSNQQSASRSQGQGSLVGCHQWGRTESDTTEAIQQQQQQQVYNVLLKTSRGALFLPPSDVNVRSLPYHSFILYLNFITQKL